MTDTLDSEEDKPELAVETKTPETILMNRSNFQLVQRAIDDLPVHYRETLLLCEVEEMSYREIAEIAHGHEWLRYRLVGGRGSCLWLINDLVDFEA